MSTRRFSGDIWMTFTLPSHEGLVMSVIKTEYLDLFMAVATFAVTLATYIRTFHLRDKDRDSLLKPDAKRRTETKSGDDGVVGPRT